MNSFLHKNLVIILITSLIFNLTSCNKAGKDNKAIPVRIEKKGNSFYLYRGGERIFIKGARTIGFQYMGLVSSLGGNSIRIGSGGNVQAKLDTAHNYGLSILFGLAVQPERNGFDYDDDEAVRIQKEEILKLVEEFKDHPAILMWALGNELDYVPGKPNYNLKLWDAVNEMAEAIKDIDPNHPVITVIGTGRKEKLKDIIIKVPAIDALGINSYGDIYEVPLWIRTHPFTKPYIITEWGPTGHWQVPRNKWGIPIEETSTEKAAMYLERHKELIDGDPWCLGGYSFLWTQGRQERTHTWYNMFYDEGERTEAVDVMEYVWTGEWPYNRAPRIDSFQLKDQGPRADILLDPSRQYSAKVFAHDPEGKPLSYEWEIYPENTEFGYAGHGEKRPPVLKDLIKDPGKSEITISSPSKPGDYRLFVYVRDRESKIAVGNIPFHVN